MTRAARLEAGQSTGEPRTVSATLARHAGALWLAAGCASMGACGDGPSGLVLDARMQIELRDIRPLATSDGVLEVWVVRGADTLSAGRIAFDPATSTPTDVVHAFDLPLAEPTEALVTVEPPGDTDDRPSMAQLLTGFFRGGTAELDILEAVTDGRELVEEPGAHSLFTTSNNAELGYPSFEDAGLWLFSLIPSANAHGTREVRLIPVDRAWTYAGWVVREYGTEAEVWVPYGKFRPDELGLLSSRDDTGSGPFSGDEDFLNAGVEDVPGEEWADPRIADLLGLHLPDDLEPPLDLDAVDGSGTAVWTHVITIEPAYDEGEPAYTDRPFILRPYRNPVGTGGPGVPRPIELREPPPTATVRVVR